MSKLLEVSNLVKTYYSGQELVQALAGIDLSVEQGDYLSIVGPSGAGKSTLLHVLSGLDSPTKGQVLFKGQDIYKMLDSELSAWRNKHIGFIFQFYHLIEELNILENVALPLSLNKKNYSLKTAQELLKYLGIADKLNFFPSQLSGGQKQRAAVARALINDSEVILCDEPTGNLDWGSQQKIILFLEKLNKEKKKTIILVTHNLELAKRANKVLFIEAGKLMQG